MERIVPLPDGLTSIVANEFMSCSSQERKAISTASVGDPEKPLGLLTNKKQEKKKWSIS